MNAHIYKHNLSLMETLISVHTHVSHTLGETSRDREAHVDTHTAKWLFTIV